MMSTLIFAVALLSVFSAARPEAGNLLTRDDAAAPKPQACAVGGEKNRNSPLSPCPARTTCVKIDVACVDWSAKGGCLGTCVDQALKGPSKGPQKGFGGLFGGPKGPPPNAKGQQQPAWWNEGSGRNKGPSQAGSGWGAPSSASPSAQPWSSPEPTAKPRSKPAPKEPTAKPWSIPAAKEPAPKPWTVPAQPAQPAPQPQQAPPPSPQQQAPPPPSPSMIQQTGVCPASIQCPNKNACTPDPRKQDSFLCIKITDTCGGRRNTACSAGKLCVNDPRAPGCQGSSCGGICV